MWVALVLKRLVDKSDAPSLSRAKFKKLESEINRSFATPARHLRLVATIWPLEVAELPKQHSDSQLQPNDVSFVYRVRESRTHTKP